MFFIKTSFARQAYFLKEKCKHMKFLLKRSTKNQSLVKNYPISKGHSLILQPNLLMP